MMAVRIAHVAWVLACSLMLVGCFDPGFDRQSEIQTWRVLSIVADPPTVGINRSVQVTPLVVDPEGNHVLPGEGVVFEWLACLRPERVPGLTSSQYESEIPSRACDGYPVLPLTPGPNGTASFFVSADALESAFTPENFALAAEVLGVPLDFLARVLVEVGMTITVQLRVCAGPAGATACRSDAEVHISAYKRVLVMALDEDDLATNPWPIRFGIRGRNAPLGDNVWLSARDVDETYRCVSESGESIVLAAGTDFLLDPEDVPLEPGPDTWIEEYTVVDAAGRFIQVYEGAFYAFYSTAGSIGFENTRAPSDEDVWTTPEEPGTYPIWVVVRDGHGGMAGCRADIDVM